MSTPPLSFPHGYRALRQKIVVETLSQQYWDCRSLIDRNDDIAPLDASPAERSIELDLHDPENWRRGVVVAKAKTQPELASRLEVERRFRSVCDVRVPIAVLEANLTKKRLGPRVVARAERRYLIVEQIVIAPVFVAPIILLGDVTSYFPHISDGAFRHFRGVNIFIAAHPLSVL